MKWDTSEHLNFIPSLFSVKTSSLIFPSVSLKLIRLYLVKSQMKPDSFDAT